MIPCYHPAVADRPRVSILIVNYRAYPELTACLESLTRQTDAPVEIIVVDYAERDTRPPHLLDRFSRVRLIEVVTNRGFAAGINRAARDARGDYLLILNPDSLADATLCATLARWLDEHPVVGAVGPLIRDDEGSIQASARRFPTVLTGLAGRSSWLTRAFPTNPLSRRNLLTGEHVQGPIDVDWVSGACVMLRRTAFDAAGGMDEGFFLYWEDADLCRRLKDAGWRTMYHPGTSVIHLAGRATRHAQIRSLIAFHRSAFRYYWKHGGLVARAFAPAAWAVLQVRLALKLVARLLGARS